MGGCRSGQKCGSLLQTLKEREESRHPVRVPRRPRGPRTDRARAGRRVHTRPAPSAEPWLLWAVSPLGAHGPPLLSHWLGFFTPQAGRRKGEKVRRERSGLSDSRFPAAARLCPDALFTSPRQHLGMEGGSCLLSALRGPRLHLRARRLAPGDTGRVTAGRPGLSVF